MNANLLKAKMALHGDNGTDLAAALGISPSGVSNRLNGNQPFTLAEVQIIIERYNLTPEEVIAIFFTQKVAECETNIAMCGT